MANGMIMYAKANPPVDNTEELDAYTSSYIYNDENNDYLMCTRLHKSVGKSWHYESGDCGNIISDFDTIYPWSEMKLCNLDRNTGDVVAYYGDENFSYSANQVMVEIPKYYYKITCTPESMTVSVSEKHLPGFHLSPRHRKIGEMKEDFNKVYIGAFMSTRSGNHTNCGSTGVYKNGVGEFISAVNRGNGWYLEDFAMFMTHYILKIVEVGAISTGFQTTEKHDFVGEKFDTPGCTTSFTSMNARLNTTLGTFKWRGIELSDFSRAMRGFSYQNLSDTTDIYIYMDPNKTDVPDYSGQINCGTPEFTHAVPYGCFQNGIDEYDFVIYPKISTEHPKVIGNFYNWGTDVAAIGSEIYSSLNWNGWCGFTRGMYLPIK